MRPKNISVTFIMFCILCAANVADAELKIDSVSRTVGVMCKNMEVTLTGSSDMKYMI